jgi:hypothetical protein
LPPSRFTDEEFLAAANKSIVSVEEMVRNQLFELSAAYAELADDHADVPAPRSPGPLENEVSEWEPARRPRGWLLAAASALGMVAVVSLIVVLLQPERPHEAIDRARAGGTVSGVAILPRSTKAPIEDPNITWRGTVVLAANGKGLDFDRKPPALGPASGPVVFTERAGDALVLRAAPAVTLTKYDGKHIPAESDCVDFLSRFPATRISGLRHDDDVCVRTAGGRTVHLDIRDVNSQGFIQAEVKVWLP